MTKLKLPLGLRFPQILMCKGNPDRVFKIKRELTHKDAKIFVDAAFFAVFAYAGATALGMYLTDLIGGFQARFYPDRSDSALYPNSFDMQYVMPDWRRTIENDQRIWYNTAIDMHSKSFSAHVDIKVHAAISFDKSSVPRNYAIADAMYVYFPGSHNVPRKTTGLGEGTVYGYVEAAKVSETNHTIHYDGTNFIRYEMSGQFPVYITWLAPSIERYDPSLLTGSPTINIASEEATNAYLDREESESNQRRQDMATLAIIAVSFIAAIPPAHEFIDRYSAMRRGKSIKVDKDHGGYSSKSTNDH